MLYAFLRWIAGIALHWFYADIRVEGRERIPENGPVMFAVNHHNALVDALIVGWIVPRRIWLTAKATLMENPAVAVLFRALGIVPLRRRSDEHTPGSPSRNEDAFKRILDVLNDGKAVLIFPEGKSHSNPALAPLKTGLARIALQARDDRGVGGLRIVPVGLSFDDKGTPGSNVLVRVGDPIDIASWHEGGAEALTTEVENRLGSLLSPGFTVGESAAPHTGIAGLAISIIAWIGFWAHRVPVDTARRIAVATSSDPDQPAMKTILYGMGLLLFFYIAVAIATGVIWGPLVSAGVILVLSTGAYWTAFKDHPRGY